MTALINLTCVVVMRVLFLTLRTLNRCDERVRQAFAAYRKGYVFRLRASMRENAPVLTFGIGPTGNLMLTDAAVADLEITVKSPKEAFMVFTGQVGIAEAYAQHRFFIKGNPYETMGLVRSMELAEAYLFPKFWARHLLLKIPEKRCSALVVYVSVCVEMCRGLFS